MMRMDIQQIKNIKLHFIVSTARTGSTLLSAMFNMHKKLLSPVEEPFAYNLYFKYASIKIWTDRTIEDFCFDFYLFSEGVLEPQFGTKVQLKEALQKHKEHLDYPTVVKIAYLCFFPERDKSNVTTIIDKQLKFHDFIEDVATFFPESKFIILNRDPRDNALVKMKRILREHSAGKEMGRTRSNYWLLGLLWKREYSLLYSKREKIGRHRFMELKYEDLVTSPEKELKRIAEFTGFEYDPVMLQYHIQTKEKIKKAEDDADIPKKMFYELHQSLTRETNTDKVGFWKSNMTHQDANIVWTICGDLARKIGYTDDGCEGQVKKDLVYYRTFLKYLVQKIMIPTLYYKMPFVFRYTIKKIKYGDRFKQNRYTSSGFQETTK